MKIFKAEHFDELRSAVNEVETVITQILTSSASGQIIFTNEILHMRDHLDSLHYVIDHVEFQARKRELV